MHGKVESGDYQSVSEVVREALRLLRERERDRAAGLTEIQAKIESGYAQSRRGELMDGEEAFRRVLRGLDEKPSPGVKNRAQKRKSVAR